MCSSVSQIQKYSAYKMGYTCRIGLADGRVGKCTASKRVLILRTWSLTRTFLAFWVLIGSLFIFQGPYFHYFGFIHAKNVNSVCMYTTVSKRVLILRTWSLIRTFLAFWVLIFTILVSFVQRMSIQSARIQQ